MATKKPVRAVTRRSGAAAIARDKRNNATPGPRQKPTRRRKRGY